MVATLDKVAQKKYSCQQTKSIKNSYFHSSSRWGRGDERKRRIVTPDIFNPWTWLPQVQNSILYAPYDQRDCKPRDQIACQGPIASRYKHRILSGRNHLQHISHQLSSTKYETLMFLLILPAGTLTAFIPDYLSKILCIANSLGRQRQGLPPEKIVSLFIVL